MTGTQKKQLREALLCLRDLEMARFDPAPTEQVEFSPAFLRFIEDCKESAKKKERAFFPLTRRWRVAAAILAAILALALTACAFYRQIGRLLVEYFPGHADFRGTDGGPDVIERVYLPTELPEGYEYSDRLDSPAGLAVWWRRGAHSLTYRQSVLGGHAESVTTEGDYRELQIDGVDVYYSEYKGRRSLYWSADGYAFALTVNDDSISLEDLLRVRESVLPEDPAPGA